MTKPKTDGWNHRQDLEDQIARLSTAIDRQRSIIARTTQRTQHDQEVAAAAEQTIRDLEANKADLIRQRNTRR